MPMVDPLLDKYGLKATNDKDEHISIEPKDKNMKREDFEKALADTEGEWVECPMKK